MLRSCYSSTWKLFKGSAVTTRGYYYFVPDDTPFYPGVHNLWSIQWVNDEQTFPAELGEQLGATRTWRNGSLAVSKPPQILVGSASCIESGDTFPEQPIPRLLVVGIDSRCWTQAGLPVPAGPAGAANLQEVQDFAVAFAPGAGINECQSLTVLPSVLATIAEAESVTVLPSALVTIAEAENLAVARAVPVAINQAESFAVSGKATIILAFHEAENLSLSVGVAERISQVQDMAVSSGGAAIVSEEQDLAVFFAPFRSASIRQAQSLVATGRIFVAVTIEQAENFSAVGSQRDVIEEAQNMTVEIGPRSPLQSIRQAQDITFTTIIM